MRRESTPAALIFLNTLAGSGIALWLLFRLLPPLVLQNDPISLQAVAGDGQLLIAAIPMIAINVLTFSACLRPRDGSVDSDSFPAVAGLVINLGLLIACGFAAGMAETAGKRLAPGNFAKLSLVLVGGAVAGAIASGILAARRSRSRSSERQLGRDFTRG